MANEKQLSLEELNKSFNHLCDAVEKIGMFLVVAGMPDQAAKMMLNDIHDAREFLESKFSESEIG